MPELLVNLTEEERQLLEQVRAAHEMASLEEAADWLISSRLHRQAKGPNRRGRALYVVGPKLAEVKKK